MLQHVVVTLFAIALAELPDKTLLATLMLSSTYKNRLAVWCGVTLGYATHVVIAVLFGAALTTLPRQPLHVLVGAMFTLGGLLTLRQKVENSDDRHGLGPKLKSPIHIVWIAASVILVAEFADLTQLATAGLAVRFDDPVAVAIGAILALGTVSGVGVVIGAWVQRHIPLRIIQRIAGVVFLLIGVTTIVTVVI